MKQKLLRLRWCRDCEIVYKTYAKYSYYCVKCFLKRVKRIYLIKLRRLYPQESLEFLPTEKVEITDDRYINKKVLLTEEIK